MRCRPGDIAIIVSAIHKENIGKIVEVICMGFAGEWVDGVEFQPKCEGPFWRIRCSSGLNFTSGLGEPYKLNEWFCRDSKLRPLRDDTGVDETLCERDLVLTD